MVLRPEAVNGKSNAYLILTLEPSYYLMLLEQTKS